ncbi:hypothetical protein OIU77_002857 [Salix suchowensis]|uniref:RING-type E3 ubiquitin transferase n=1 Tax=Salix suchowensis TaxID=1278906 RepID=A0ABQ9AYY1_9ROSI|nr:hypothetical protein OIU77_002857 [Salix suchowensis]
MALQYRRLLYASYDDCVQACKSGEDPEGCDSDCSSFSVASSPHKKLGKIALAMILLSAIICVLVSCYAIYARFIRPRRRRSAQREEEAGEEERIEIRDHLVDEDQGPVVDHPIWYIRTVGLQPSVIGSITVCKYKSGDGLVEDTECSVCLNEFQDDETLSTAITPPSQANIADTSSGEETGTEVLEEDQESGREMEGGDGGLRVVTQEESELQGENLNEEEDGIQPLRRSISLDSLSAFKIIQALADVHPAVESDRNSGTRRAGGGNGSIGESVQNRGGGNQNLMKSMATSSFGRTFQIGPSTLKRSFSCTGKFSLSRPCRNRNSGRPS